jgi:hypothetical protein
MEFAALKEKELIMKYPIRTYWNENEKHPFPNRDRFSSEPLDRHFQRDRGYESKFRGVGPKGYRRSDESIREDICESLTLDPYVDATEIEVAVKEGVVFLRGTVSSREVRRMAEDAALDCTGVVDVRNELIPGTRFQNQGMLASRWESQQRESARKPKM